MEKRLAIFAAVVGVVWTILVVTALVLGVVWLAVNI